MHFSLFHLLKCYTGYIIIYIGGNNDSTQERWYSENLAVSTSSRKQYYQYSTALEHCLSDNVFFSFKGRFYFHRFFLYTRKQIILQTFKTNVVSLSIAKINIKSWKAISTRCLCEYKKQAYFSYLFVLDLKHVARNNTNIYKGRKKESWATSIEYYPRSQFRDTEHFLDAALASYELLK